jgi:hypothetical protein
LFFCLGKKKDARKKKLGNVILVVETFWRRQSFLGDVLLCEVFGGGGRGSRLSASSIPLAVQQRTCHRAVACLNDPSQHIFVSVLFVYLFGYIQFGSSFAFFLFRDIPSERLNPSFGCLIQCDNETGRRNFLHPADKHTNNPKKISSSIPVAPSPSAPYTKQQQQ